MRYVAIGDIHGNYNELNELLEVLWNETDFSSDTFIFLGDYVDGGPDTDKVLYSIIDFGHLYPHWVFLKGNHEDLMLDALRYNGRRYDPGRSERNHTLWWEQGGRATFESFAKSQFPEFDDYHRSLLSCHDVITDDILDWVDARPLIHETDEFVFVHAGLRPHKEIHETSEMDMLWIRSYFYTSGYDWGKRVVFGHTYFENPIVEPNKIGIDTLVRYGNTHRGHLSAVILDSDHPERQRFVTADPAICERWNDIWS